MCVVRVVNKTNYGSVSPWSMKKVKSDSNKSRLLHKIEGIVDKSAVFFEIFEI